MSSVLKHFSGLGNFRMIITCPDFFLWYGLWGYPAQERWETFRQVMIANVSPCSGAVEHSLNTLRHRCWAPLVSVMLASEQDRMHMGVSENSVPLNPMVNDHYPY